MNLFTPSEFVENFAAAGEKKTALSVMKLFLLGILAGFFIALGGVVSNTATFGFTNTSAMRIISGLLFPFGLIMVILTGAELFTGNCLITISVLEKRTTLLRMLRNLIIVYLGNFAGSVMAAAGCAYFGQYNCSAGALAVYTIKVAGIKCALPFLNAFVSGIFCNILVCAAVMLSLSAKELIGRVAGAYIPIAFFVICGFEHCVANMYYIPAGLFAKNIPAYAKLVSDAGLDITKLTWGNFFASNLLPVTLGNIAGGVLFAILVWVCHRQENKGNVRTGMPH